MYQIGAMVVYGSEGVCTVSEIKSMSFGGTAEAPYYILTPNVNPNSKIFVPCNNEALVSRMQKVLSADEIKKMLSDTSVKVEWIQDNRQRNKAFKEILLSYDRAQIFALARLLYSVKKGTKENKKLFASDEDILKKIIKILHSELSLVLEITPEEVIPYILGEIECKIK